MSRLTLSQVFARPSAVAVLYSIAALLLTWPLAAVVTHQVAGDASDTLFNCWVLQWTSGQAMRALHGDLSALRHYWDGNIFYPASLTLAYSNHLTPQLLQALPVLASTGNIVLAYNLLFLATIVLSGLGVYLLVRAITHEPLAAFVGGLAFAFAPYRIDQYVHLEVLSSEWMPFALFGLRRFIVTGRLLPLAGGTAAVVVQALSCGYYLAYFAPFVVAYCLCELALQNRLRDGATWRALVGAGAIALIVVGTFSWPYAECRRRGDGGAGGGRRARPRRGRTLLRRHARICDGLVVVAALGIPHPGAAARRRRRLPRPRDSVLWRRRHRRQRQPCRCRPARDARQQSTLAAVARRRPRDRGGRPRLPARPGARDRAQRVLDWRLRGPPQWAPSAERNHIVVMILAMDSPASR